MESKVGRDLDDPNWFLHWHSSSASGFADTQHAQWMHHALSTGIKSKQVLLLMVRLFPAISISKAPKQLSMQVKVGLSPASGGKIGDFPSRNPSPRHDSTNVWPLCTSSHELLVGALLKVMRSFRTTCPVNTCYGRSGRVDKAGPSESSARRRRK